MWQELHQPEPSLLFKVSVSAFYEFVSTHRIISFSCTRSDKMIKNAIDLKSWHIKMQLVCVLPIHREVSE